jgi:hypothetical protein
MAASDPLASVTLTTFRMIGAGVGAVRDGPEVVGARNHALGEQEPSGQLAIGAGRPHDHRERVVVQPHLERLLGRRAI